MNFTRKLFQRTSNRFSTFGKQAFASKKFLRSTLFATTATAVGAQFLWFNTDVMSSFKASFDDELQQISIGASEEFTDGRMREIQVGDDKDKDLILVARIDGKLYACGAKCSHFGAPLSKGMLFEDRVYCPWHLASFSVKTGYADNGPMMDGLPVYKIWESDGKVFVETPKKITVNKQALPTVTRDPNNKERFVIIGGGIAGGSAAETLRASGFTGEIILLTGEDSLPYDRTALTKGNGTLLKIQAKHLELRDQSYFDRLGIEVRTGTLVTDVNGNTKNIVTKNGDHLSYDKLLVASGTSPVAPPVPGVNSNNVFTVRDIQDAIKIREAVAAGAKNIVVIGAGFIGVEAAGTLKMELKDDANITVVSGGSEAYASSLGPQVGKALRLLSEENGVQFKFGSKLASIESGEDGNVNKVQLKDGTVLDADMVILGTGVSPNTWFLNGGVALDNDGGLNTDAFLRSTSHKDIYGAGDVASFPYFYTAERTRVEHISEAMGMGAFAAMNMTGKMVPYNGVPFFWTRAFNKSLAYVGNTKTYDNVNFFF